MSDFDLIFDLPYNGPTAADLVFGDESEAPVRVSEVLIQGRLPGLRGRLGVRVVRTTRVVGRLAPLGGVVRVRYNSDTPRPVVNTAKVVFQPAEATRTGVCTQFNEATPLASGVCTFDTAADPLHVCTDSKSNEAVRTQHAHLSIFTEAVELPTSTVRNGFEEAQARHNTSTLRFTEASRLGLATARTHFQETHRDRRNFAAVTFQGAKPYSQQWSQQGGAATPIWAKWCTEFQQGMKPPAGIWVRPVPKPQPPCYDPTQPPHLLFVDPWTGSTNLIFKCKDSEDPKPEPGATIVVPIQEVYLTINSAVLVRVDNGHFIPATAMTMKLDCDSWTWSFGASVPASAQASVMPNSNGDPVVVQATINGTPYRFVVEEVSRNRSFNSAQLTLSGRGLGAELADPYAPQLTFGNAQPRNARQLLDDILTYNNVPVGWEIDNFYADDWPVPAGVFSHTGTYISALNAVVGSVAGYLQPHDTDRKMDVYLKYPVPAWQWGDVTPDIELPEARVNNEGVRYEDKPKYNRVYVHGQEGGVLGRYTRTGSGGLLTAPAVVDPLITHATAARQRGRAIISDTGRIETVTLKLAIAPETGVIKPGKFIRYTEGGRSHIGLSRGVQVDVSMPTIYQTITLEVPRHESV